MGENNMARHELKIWPEHFQPVHDGIKLAELRKDDRSPPIVRHDELLLVEFDPAENVGFTGRKILDSKRVGPFIN
jgi:hypothetical protein